jgi:uncharacterized membrane protein YeaQ/YmgE (transglycosylase-associated protein family)
MDLISILVFLAIGAVAGWLAGLIFKGGGFGLLWNIIIGILGGVIGGWIFGNFFGSGWVGGIVTAMVGALILLFVANIISGKSK